MSMNDTLSAALSHMLNSERSVKHECMIKPVSKTIKNVLELLKKYKYIKGYKEIKDSKGNYFIISLSGQINKCGAIKPRHAVKHDCYEKYEKRYLLAKGFGMLIVSTPQGIMTHEDAKSNRLGGKLLAYCY